MYRLPSLFLLMLLLTTFFSSVASAEKLLTPADFERLFNGNGDLAKIKRELSSFDSRSIELDLKARTPLVKGEFETRSSFAQRQSRAVQQNAKSRAQLESRKQQLILHQEQATKEKTIATLDVWILFDPPRGAYDVDASHYKTLKGNPLDLSKSSGHPARVTFAPWLKNVNCPEETARMLRKHLDEGKPLWVKIQLTQARVRYMYKKLPVYLDPLDEERTVPILLAILATIAGNEEGARRLASVVPTTKLVDFNVIHIAGAQSFKVIHFGVTD